jgi:hypothetical protein
MRLLRPVLAAAVALAERVDGWGTAVAYVALSRRPPRAARPPRRPRRTTMG